MRPQTGLTMSVLSIVDSHVHLWDPSVLRYPWLDELPPLNRAFLPADFSAASARQNINKIIFVEAGGAPGQSFLEAQWVASLAKHEPRLKGVVAHAVLENGRVIQHELKALATQPLIKGIRRNLQGEPDADFCRHPNFMDGVRLLAEFGFTFDLCIRHDQLPAVTELVQQIPEVTFILDHCGKPDIRHQQTEPWAKNLKALAALPNIVCKLSGLTTEADLKNWQPADLKFYAERVLGVFGFDRVMFASDWPVATLATTYDRWVETIAGFVSSAPAADQLKLFQTNAERIYRV